MTSPKHPIRLAVWSGPRNISTALLRSWGNRSDTFVCDEPFYAYYLSQTGMDHPGAQEIIQHYSTHWEEIVNFLVGDIPGGKRIFYQKQMNKHMVNPKDMSWIFQLTNCFLIRNPREMILSFHKIVPNPSLDDFGLVEQVDMFRQIQQETGQAPLVLDATDILKNPKDILGKWCESLGIEFTNDMLKWEPGIRKTDGIWAKYWYKNVIQSTGFAPYKPKNEPVPKHLEKVLAECEELYGYLYSFRIK